MTDLRAEMRDAQLRVRQAHLDQLRRLGVRPVDAAKLGATQPIIGVARIEFLQNFTFQLLDGGKPNAFIQPVVEQDGEILDNIAWSPMAPSKWVWRISAAWIMGRLPPVGSWSGAEPLRVFRTPLEWLAGGGDGVCILDWNAPEVRSLERFPAFVVDEPAFGRKLQDAVTRPTRRPEIIIRDARRAA